MAEQVDPALETGVLAGLRVVELGRRIAGPVVGMVLAEQGAEVIRVVQQDQPEEDPVLAALLARGKTELGHDLEFRCQGCRPERYEMQRELKPAAGEPAVKVIFGEEGALRVRAGVLAPAEVGVRFE